MLNARKSRGALDPKSLTAILCCVAALSSGCVSNRKLAEADFLPDSQVSIIALQSGTTGLFKVSDLHLHYVDGAEQMGYGWSFITTGRLLPGKHALGIMASWGGFFGQPSCMPIFPLSLTSCPNSCYAGVVLSAEAGRKYKYDIANEHDKIYVLILDQNDQTAASGICESIPTIAGVDSSNTPMIKAINERIEKYSRD